MPIQHRHGPKRFRYESACSPSFVPQPHSGYTIHSEICANTTIGVDAESDASLILLQRTQGRESLAASQRAALVTEASDQHIATLATSLTPQVVSTDRHTVKPWFQGKITFSFNLPEALPENTTLDGANLTYLGSQPVAQLLYSIGKHRVSVFLREKTAPSARELEAEHSGFHVQGLATPDLDVVAVSDVDPARLSYLAHRIQAAQTGATSLSK